MAVVPQDVPHTQLGDHSSAAELSGGGWRRFAPPPATGVHDTWDTRSAEIRPSVTKRPCVLIGDRQHYWKGALLQTLDESTIEVLMDFTRRMPSAMSGIGLQHAHGAPSRVPRDAAAFPHRVEFCDAPILAQWADPAESDRHIAWARAAWAALAPLASDGVQVNNQGVEGQDRARGPKATTMRGSPRSKPRTIRIISFA
jgi:hypothetical protein